MDFLNHLLDQSRYSLLSAVLLGLMTASAPCSLAANIAAIGYIGKTVDSGKRVFLHGLVYTLGLVCGYLGLALLLYAGAEKLQLTLLFEGWGEKIIGPVFVLIGLTLLDVIRFNLPGLNRLAEKLAEQQKGRFIGSFLLGLFLSVTFCPYTGVLFFGMMMPLAVSSPAGLALPVVYALSCGLPVVVFAAVFAFAVRIISRYYTNVKLVEKWVRRLVAVVFILAGLYFIITLFR